MALFVYATSQWIRISDFLWFRRLIAEIPQPPSVLGLMVRRAFAVFFFYYLMFMDTSTLFFTLVVEIIVRVFYFAFCYQFMHW